MSIKFAVAYDTPRYIDSASRGKSKLVALGGFKTTHDALTVIAGVVIIATVGKMLRRARIVKAELEEMRTGDRN